MKTKEERQKRVIARGETSGHSHIITGECEIKKEHDGMTVTAGSNCVIKHLLEKPFVDEGVEVWTQEHKDIALKKGNTYRYIQQKEFDPFERKINEVID
ncbi:MAG: hypothetical protein ACTSPO_15505 [Candidatus Heimdallarchaeaceae archaeon]